uniref:ATP synthase complex subunit 8 n=1 Tax=Deroplatys desiccata TaxID=627733 RepID=A0A343UMF8_9NEOP|nr:ATP synthase F0 subunit 8 [Deroplatys desiccata]AVE15458.1 ATP synthase F0 subunit 8 [Deroplatys desiccata]
MPQMMPMNWLILFYIFSILMLLINVMNFYVFFHKSSIYSTSTMLKNKYKTWKW